MKDFNDFKKSFLENDLTDISILIKKQVTESLKEIDTNDLSNLASQLALSSVKTSIITSLAAIEKYHNWLIKQDS